MENIGLFYGSTHGATEEIAKMIQEEFGKDHVDLINIKDAKASDLEKYKNVIFGTSAWGIGDMQDDWERFVYKLEYVDFSNKKIALFGLGDQKEYPESFVDGLGTLFCRIPAKQQVVGYWPTSGYKYYFSIAERDGKFVGLVIDQHSQKRQSKTRVKKWVEQLKKELN